ncbi:hypothetical protein LCGC14_1885490 [marine sediment metagenome]|uniref:Uncharacterized protein n=1 Tax=marine sediment metagenome TaxID=412755 RepID=A0A0F9G143_9ZZZZ
MAKFFLQNPGFELGDRDWSKGTGWAISKDAPTSRSGSWRAVFTGAAEANLDSTLFFAVRPGLKVSASVYFDGAVATAGTGVLRLKWSNSNQDLLSVSSSAGIAFGSGYSQEVLTDIVAPAQAKFVQVRAVITTPNGSTWRLDDADMSGSLVENLPSTAKIQSHTLVPARTIGMFDPLIGVDKFTEFNAGMSDKWGGMFTFIPLHPSDDLGELLGFLERLGRIERFFAFDPDRLVPKNGVVNNMTVDGTTTNGTNRIPVKAGPVSSTALVVGDYIEIKDQYFQLKRDLEIGPEGTGEAIVWPSVRSTFADGEDIITDNPKMIARVTSEVPRRSDHDRWTQLSMSWEEV